MNAAGTRRRVLFLSGWYVHALHEGVADFAAEAGWILENELCYSGQCPTAWQGDGLLCRHAFRRDMLDLAAAVQAPRVGFEAHPDWRGSRVYYDEQAMGRLAAEHLLARGYRRLAFFHLHLTPFQAPRQEGFRRAAETAGAECIELAPPDMPPWPLPPAYDGSWLTEPLQALGGPPVGIMASNDAIARPLLRGLDAIGWRVPEHAAVVSAENDPLLCRLSPVSLSSVESDTRRLGYEAARLLQHLMDGGAPPAEPRLLPPRGVVARESTNLLALDHPHAAHALHFIWTHYHEALTVDRIAAEVPISRRHLQTIFRDALGRTLQDELTRVRLHAACQDIRRGGSRMQEIARRHGFSNSAHMHRAFVAAFGCGPRAWAAIRPHPPLPSDLPAALPRPPNAAFPS